MMFAAKSSGQLIFLIGRRKILLERRVKPPRNPRTNRNRKGEIKSLESSKEKVRERR
jgi:hypothetical protein